MFAGRFSPALKFCLAALIAVILVGCGTTQPTVVEKVRTVYITVPESMTKPVTPQRPMAKADYLAMEVYDRERAITVYSTELMKSLGQCNAQLTSIRNIQGTVK